MNDQARERLCELLATYGPAICNTPRSCEMFLRQKVGEFPDEFQMINKALQGGTVGQLMQMKGISDWESASAPLVSQLSQSAGISPEQARWTIDAWGIALRKHPNVAPPPPPAEPQRIYPDDAPQRDPAKLAAQLCVTVFICGGIGGALGGSLRGLLNILMMDMLADWMEIPEGLSYLMALIDILVALIAGGLGALLGFWIGGGHVTTHWPRDGSTPVYIYRAFMAALGGAFFGASVGTFVCGGALLMGAGPIGAFVGAFGGSLASVLGGR
jgi:hypothetical protein